MLHRTSRRGGRSLAAALRLGTCALAISAASVATTPVFAQSTTSSMTGLVLLPNGEPAAGALVEILHTPSGTRNVASVNAQGRFNASGLRVGGPYTVSFTGPGIPRNVVENVFINLGEPFAIDLVLQNAAAGQAEQMEEIVVTGERITDQLAIGGGRSFDAEAIRNTPTISRSIADIVRRDPKIFIDRSNGDAISIAGTNNRFNSLTVDGVKQNDDFGLNASGFATQRSPISLDALEAVSVQTAPFSVEYSGFQGGNINIVTKSGTNEFSGSAFYLYGDDSLAGDRSGDRPINITFEEKTWGATLGGPIIRDKLFFFASYENFDRTAPVSTGPRGSGFPNETSNVTLAEYNQVLSVMRTVYGYDPLDLESNLQEKDEKILGKIDWNVNDNHRVSLSYQRTDGNQVEQTGAGTTSVSAPSHWYDRAILLEQYTGQLFSDWTDEFSTELKIARKEVETRQDPLAGLNFARIGVRTPSGGFVNLGPDISRHANFLTNDLNQVKLKGDYQLGDHTITVGYEREELDIFNLFIQRALGDYDFDSITDLQNRRAQRFRYSNATTNNTSDGAASFGYNVDSFYIQDEWQVTPDLRVSAGLRYETYSSDDRPPVNQNFVNRYGFANTESYDGRDLWQPRLGFEYDVTDRTKVRGGVGIFGGGTPNVWISNSYSNDGISVVSQDYQRANATLPSPVVPGTTFAVLDNVTGRIPAAVLTRNSQLAGDGTVNAIDPDFEMPSTWRYLLAVDHSADLGFLGDDWRFTVEAQYSEVRDAVLWQDLRLVQSGTAPDGRPIYTARPGRSFNDLLLTNTSEGDSLVLTFDVSKDWETDFGDFGITGAYAWQDSNDVNPGTSSVAFSNWQNVAVTDPNNPDVATSNYEIKHRFTWTATWSREFMDGFATSFTLLGEHRSGLPYSLVFAGGTGASLSGAFGDEGQRSRQLFYVPRDCNDVVLTGGLTCDGLNAFISRNDLEQYRGQITPRNAFRSDWVHTVDLNFRQEIPSFLEGHRASFTLDVLNFTNLLNNDWGRIEQVQFPYAVGVARANLGADGRYIYRPASGTDFTNPTQSIDARAIPSAIWRIQVGVRYEF